MKLADAIRSYAQYRKDVEDLYIGKIDINRMRISEKPQFRIPKKFWLSRIFDDNIKVPYYLGLMIFFYAIWEVPRLITICLLLHSGSTWIASGLIDETFFSGYLNLQFIGLLGDLMVPVCWIFLRRNHKFLFQFNKDLQRKLQTNFLMPKEIIVKDDLEEIEEGDKQTAANKLEKLDKMYTTRFFFGSLSKLLQLLYDLIVNARYQLTFGLIAFCSSVAVGWASGWFQSNWMFATVDQSLPQLSNLASIDYFLMAIMTGWFWFTLAVIGWTSFHVLTVCTLVSGPIVVDFDPDAPLTLRKQYYSITRLALSNALLIAFLTTWVPLMMFFSVQINPLQGQNLTFLVALIAIMLPIILLLSIWPCWYARQGILRSKERKEFTLKIEKEELENRGEREHPDYKRVRERLEKVTEISTWPLDTKLLLSIIGQLVIPMLSILASIYFT